MHRRSSLWFILAAAWFVLLVLNISGHHRDKNTLVIGIAVAAFLGIGAAYRRKEAKAPGRPKLK